MGRIWLLTVLLALAGCSETDDVTAPARTDATTQGPAHYDDGTGIAWLKGDVDGAFALAAAAGKPVFLYWGAAWCPPCHEIRAAVFKTREFVERSRQFVAVYLDGDSDDAQRYGEQFGVMGYPTIIVFSPQGEELTRIASGIDIAAFANVLDLALSSLQPVADIADSVLGGTPPDARACRLFAYYSWDQDNERILASHDAGALFSTMAEQCAEQTDAARLTLLYLGNALDRADDAGTPAFAEPAADRARFAAILDDPDAVLANPVALIFRGPRLVEALTAPNSVERNELANALANAYDAISAADTVYLTERLYATGAKVALERIDDETAPISDDLRTEVLTRVAWADATTEDAHERQAVINAAANVLTDAGLASYARELLLREIERSEEPYYFMSGLAELAEAEGDNVAALNWLKRAHEASRGPATRFQWGRAYVSGLIRLTPEDGDAIESETIALFTELGADRNAFYHRNARVMSRLEQQLREWNTDAIRQVHIDSIRTSVHALCTTLPPADRGKERCEAFLATA